MRTLVYLVCISASSWNFNIFLWPACLNTLRGYTSYMCVSLHCSLTDRYNLMRIDVSSSAKCYEICPNSSPSDVTWCVYIYHPTENVSLCLKNTGTIRETPTAALLELEKQFVVKQVGALLYLFSVVNIYIFHMDIHVCSVSF